jgi:hypothetical protein
MNEIEIHVHTENGHSPGLIKIDEHSTIEDLLRLVAPTNHADLLLFVGEETEPRDRQRTLHQSGIAHHHHVHCRKHHERVVTIVINGKKRETKSGSNSVEHLKNIGGVPADEILSEFKDGQFVDLKNDAHVEICGGEVFASHVQSAGSS